ncbi:MAG: glycosyltransferase N-terminal domain-containing protein, partial [Planctomycetota bacterium]
MPRPLDLLYLTVLGMATPYLAYRRFVQGKDRSGWKEKLTGRVEPRADAAEANGRPCVWWHAVSVGEALQLPNLIAALAERRPDAVPVVTVSTGTGLEVARKKLPRVAVYQAPMDFTWAIDAFLRRTKPSALALVELELWPNLVRRCEAAGVPVAVVNGRLSEKSFRGYRRIKPLIRGTFARLGWVGVQTGEYADRFIALGTNRRRVAVTGSVKYDGLRSDPHNAATDALRRQFGLNPFEPLLLAGSTGEPEEAVVLDAFALLQKTIPNCRLLIAPRHAERFDAVAALIETRGHSLRRLSTVRQAGDRREPAVLEKPEETRRADAPRSQAESVLLLDTLGDLSAA